jgi:hypothetical protein
MRRFVQLLERFTMTEEWSWFGSFSVAILIPE